MKDKKIINSYYGVTLESKVIEQGSNTLVVLLPGMGYTLDMPLIIYSQDLALEMGLDVLPIEYGFQAAKKEFDGEEELRIVINESYEILKKSLDKKYEKIIFIGKSIGTFFQRKLQDKLVEDNFEGRISNIYLTPVDMTAGLGLKEDSLVILGSKDTLISNENKEKIKEIDKVKYIEIENTGHSLDIRNDVINSIEIIKEIMINEKEYLQYIC